jgi:hypothetical protein
MHNVHQSKEYQLLAARLMAEGLGCICHIYFSNLRISV